MNNRRRDKRYRVQCNGALMLEGHRINIESVNISHRGIRINLDKPLLEGTPVTLTMPLNNRLFNGPFEAPGVVVWCSEGMEVGFEAGILLKLSLETSTKLSTFLETDLPSS